MQTGMEFSAGMSITGCPWDQHLWHQEGINRIGQRERSRCITGQTTLTEPMESWSEGSPSGLSWHVQWPGIYTSTRTGHCIEAAPRRPGGWRLPTYSTSSNWRTSPWREVWAAHLHVMQQHVSQFQTWVIRLCCGENSWWRHVSQNDDLVILLSALWSRKSREGPCRGDSLISRLSPVVTPARKSP